MVDGVFFEGEDVTQTLPSGEWERGKSNLRNWITPTGDAGPTGKAGFAAEANRYHLFVAWNCPWAHRTLLVRALKRLDGILSKSVARPNRTAQGWIFDESGAFSDPVLKASAVHEVYSRAGSGYTGRLTVPVLWDKANNEIVSNESADIVRMLNSAFAGVVPETIDLYPLDKRPEIDTWNALIYDTINNGVYRAGFASSQDAYATAAVEVFDNLDRIDQHLAGCRYLCGEALTEADVRLFPTLARFDVAYHYAFRCNLKRLTDYRHLWPYARELYQMGGIADTVHFDIYKQGYFSRSEKRNPLGIVPIGPQIDWSEPHNR